MQFTHRRDLGVSATVSDHSDHPLSGEMLKSIVETLSTVLTLCLHCRSPDPPAGKLQTQSEISIVATALVEI
ncbi:hypothetical protein ZOSMA_47G00280 [Zostera marina]|uniref:DUF7032 domain-containing protein n=1 Tax=Zostera marina TaxID=29655 RepID=A0A0K9NZT9_ZOSMR|nr:hypothetical protein ZOSMA_47G00280 [Zostera marina]